MGFRSVPQSVTLNDLEQRNGPYSTLFRLKMYHQCHWTVQQYIARCCISSPNTCSVTFNYFYVARIFVHICQYTVSVCLSGEEMCFIIPVLPKTEPRSLRAARGYRLWQIKWCDSHLCHVTGNARIRVWYLP